MSKVSLCKIQNIQSNFPHVQSFVLENSECSEFFTRCSKLYFGKRKMFSVIYHIFKVLFLEMLNVQDFLQGVQSNLPDMQSCYRVNAYLLKHIRTRMST